MANGTVIINDLSHLKVFRHLCHLEEFTIKGNAMESCPEAKMLKWGECSSCRNSDRAVCCGCSEIGTDGETRHRNYEPVDGQYAYGERIGK